VKENVGRVNLPIAIFAIALSLLLFMIVLPERLSKRLRPISISLTVEGLDAKHLYVAKQPSSVKVWAEVTDEEYKSFSAEATAVAELYGAQAGSHMYPVSLSPRGLRNIVRDGIPQASFNLEALKTREIPVIVTSSGKLSDPTEIVDRMKPDPNRATIDGPADQVAKVVNARAILRLDMLDPHSNQQLVSLDPVDIHDNVVDQVDIHPAQVVISPQFSLAPQQKQAFVEADFGGSQVPSGYEVKNYSIDPTRITASGSSEALSRIAKVSTLPIDLSKMTVTQTITVQLKPVRNDVRLSPTSVQVTIIVEPVTLKGLSPGAGRANTTGVVKPAGSSTGL